MLALSPFGVFTKAPPNPLSAGKTANVQGSLAHLEVMNMKKRQSRRQNTKILHSRWVAYATAGAATALTASHSTEAGIHYQVVNQKFQPTRIRQGGFSWISPVIPFILHTFLVVRDRPPLM